MKCSLMGSWLWSWGRACCEKLVHLLWFQWIPWLCKMSSQGSPRLCEQSLCWDVVLRDGAARGVVPRHISGNSCYVTREKRLAFCRTFPKSKWFILSGFESHSDLEFQGSWPGENLIWALWNPWTFLVLPVRLNPSSHFRVCYVFYVGIWARHSSKISSWKNWQ